MTTKTNTAAVNPIDQKEDKPMKNVFEILGAVNVNVHTEQKNGLTYLSWACAWAEVKKRYENASYEIVKDANGLPYFGDPRTGIMVYTRVTIDGITHEMWLPVMDSANNAMKFESYEIQTRYGTKTVAAATMFDINKTIMRCLVKNLAMFGLGLYIYAGEDLPEEEARKQDTKAVEAAKPTRAALVKQLCAELEISVEVFGRYLKAATQSNIIPDKRINDLSDADFDTLMNFVKLNAGQSA